MRLISIVMTAALASGCSLETTADPNIAPPEASGDVAEAGQKGHDGLHAIIYKIGGTARKGLITYTTPSGQEQKNGARVPWQKSFKAEDGEFLSVSAQNDAGGTITCTITVDGKTIKRGKSSGAYAIVSCDGMIGF